MLYGLSFQICSAVESISDSSDCCEAITVIPITPYVARAHTCEVKSTIIATRISSHITLTQHRFGLLPFRSPLLRESLLIYFPAVTKRFQFTAFPHSSLNLSPHSITCARFPDSEIFEYNVRWQLLKAYRNLLRPSSAFCTKASTMCPYLFFEMTIILFNFQRAQNNASRYSI